MALEDGFVFLFSQSTVEIYLRVPYKLRYGIYPLNIVKRNITAAK